MPEDHYTPPTGAEARALLKALGLTGAAAGNLVGVDSRTVRRWTGGERAMPFASLYTILSRQARLEVTPKKWREQVGEKLQIVAEIPPE
jgi:transcriptional regulator with XRE-family HTH domain